MYFQSNFQKHLEHLIYKKIEYKTIKKKIKVFSEWNTRENNQDKQNNQFVCLNRRKNTSKMEWNGVAYYTS